MASSPVRHPLFARLLEWNAGRDEKRGQAELRRELLAGLSGRVLEVGAGTGVNFAHYPASVEELVAVEPEPKVPALVEGMVPFEREISVIAVRGRQGEMRFYDAVENVHEGGILARSRVPAGIAPALSVEAKTIAGKIAEALSYVGVLFVELFARGGERPDLLVNEFAPRVHNSGHWTLDACLISQFENHIRAIAGWPLGETARHSDAVMTNLIGADVETWREAAAEPDIAVHLYGKTEARKGRKMGHVTRLYPKS